MNHLRDVTEARQAGPIAPREPGTAVAAVLVFLDRRCCFAESRGVNLRRELRLLLGMAMALVGVAAALALGAAAFVVAVMVAQQAIGDASWPAALALVSTAGSGGAVLVLWRRRSEHRRRRDCAVDPAGGRST
ncbi:MAG: hypothetical protein HKP61_08070 [Dactylosporangium sp.]|nr:hypothetical protein [Dactylosporangium sp.]NNJ60893.1 hypothetical protein [Dactylosporangium sp.]